MMHRSMIWCRHFYLPYHKIIKINQISYKAESALTKALGHSF